MINARLFEHYGIDTGKDLALEIKCPRPFDTVLIDKMGSCYACECQAWLPQSIGNLKIKTLEEILNSKTHQTLQDSITDGTYRYCNNHQCAWLLDAKNPPDWPTQAPETRVRFLRLAIDDSCNLQCPSCRKHMIFHKQGNTFTQRIRLADRINDWLHRCEHDVNVHIGSDGDPFASHVYRHFMEHTPDRPNISYSILTNALLFRDFHDRAPHVTHGLKELGVSIDGATKETYERLRLGGRWEKIVDNLEFIRGLKQTLDFRFVMQFVVQKHNYHEMEAIVELARLYGADRIWLNRITDWQTFDDFREHDVVSVTHPEHTEFQKAFEKIKTNDNFVEYATLE